MPGNGPHASTTRTAYATQPAVLMHGTTHESETQHIYVSPFPGHPAAITSSRGTFITVGADAETKTLLYLRATTADLEEHTPRQPKP